jgi:hypothetical protein
MRLRRISSVTIAVERSEVNEVSQWINDRKPMSAYRNCDFSLIIDNCIVEKEVIINGKNCSV